MSRIISQDRGAHDSYGPPDGLKLAEKNARDGRTSADGIVEQTSADDMLGHLGYDAQLSRNRSTSHVAFMAFVLAANPYGLATTLNYPLIGGGPVNIIWGWLLVALIVICVAASLGEITSIYPTAGGGFVRAPSIYGPVDPWLPTDDGLTRRVLPNRNAYSRETPTSDELDLWMAFCRRQYLYHSVCQLWHGDLFRGLSQRVRVRARCRHLSWTDISDFSHLRCHYPAMQPCCLVGQSLASVDRRELLDHPRPPPLERFCSSLTCSLKTFAIFWTFAGVIAIIISVLVVARNGRRSAGYVFGHFETQSGWPYGWSFCIGLMHAGYATSSTGMIIS
ncbi:amino acid transporter [Colletotrichum truncatum]|uniref:Amino acid transporter n=1 Tax=Colletotrichum truncatum TaxID=5467 RepID=A0ACC3YHW3_COLTU|nr:amino acid transporter [Colletotrichum truncatum]KAF6786012.1 amino acid transporter [Colletotrichum truncatum]